MKQEVGEGKELKVEYLLVDLASFASVKDFVKTFKEKNLPLHILINNAGIAWVPYSKLRNLCVSFVPRSRLSKEGKGSCVFGPFPWFGRLCGCTPTLLY